MIGVAVLHLPPVRSRVLDRARAYAEREFGVTLRASSLGYNLFTRSIELRDLSLASPSTDQPFLEADRAIVVLGTGVFRGRITITRISLSRPRVTLVRYADGRVNLPSSRKDGQRASSLQLGIVAVTALSARLDDRVAQRNITVGPLDLSVDTASTSGQPGAFGPGGFTVRTGQVETSGTIAGRLAFDGTRVRIEDLTAETREGRIALTGWADVIGDQPAISARVNATVDVPQAARLASVDTRGLSGHLEGTIDVAGALAAPTVTVSVASGDTRYAPIGPVRLAGRSTFSGGRALIENLDVESAVGLLQVQGVIELGETPPARAGTPSRLTLRWSNLRVDDLVQAYGQQLPIRSGSIASGSGTVGFDARDRSPRAWSRLSATATTTLEPAVNVSSRENLALSGRTDLRVDAGRWSLRHSLQARSTQIELAGDVTGRLLESAEGLRSTLAGRSRIRVADISAVPHLMGDAGVKIPPHVVEGLAGSMLATVDLAGTIEHPLARIDVEARDVRLGVLPHAAVLDARLDVDASGVRAHDVQGTAGTTSLHVSGKYAWRGPFDARVELSEGNLSELASRFKLPVSVSGSARLEGTMSGTISSAVRSGHGTYALSARELAVEQIPIGPLAATGTFTLANTGEMTVNAAAPAVGARAQLQVANRAGYPVSGEITLEHKEIGALVPPRYRQQTGDLSGELSATARGTGHLSDPAGMRGRIDLRVLDVVARGTRIRLAAPGSITLTDDRIVVNSVDLRVGEHTRATLGGQLGVAVLPDPLRFHVDGPLSELIDIGARATDATPVAVRGDGTATLDVTVAGTLGRPLPSGSLAVSSPSLQYGTFSPVTDLTLDATIDPTLITLRSLVARWQNASLGGEGTVPWRVILSSLQAPSVTTQSSRLAGWLNALPAEPSRARLTIRADDVTEAVLRDVVAAERLEEVQGRATATVTVEADRLSLEHVLATAVLGRASLTLAGVPFTQTVPTRLRLEKGWARITDFQWSAEGNSIVATGEANLAAARPSMDLGVSGAVDLRVLGAFVSGISSGGMAHADLAVTGPFDNPDVIGRITVADGELQVDTPRLAASNLEGTVQIAAGRRVTVSVAGFVNTGKATLGGTLDLANLAAPLGKLQFTGREIALEYPPGLQTESNADIELALAGTNSALTGRIDVLGGNYREALVLSSQLLSLSSTNGIARAAPPAEWLSRIRLNVAVATASDVRIDNNYGRFDIGASLRLVGTLASPGVLGRLQALDGGEI
jgi:hypothetical protein